MISLDSYAVEVPPVYLYAVSASVQLSGLVVTSVNVLTQICSFALLVVGQLFS